MTDRAYTIKEIDTLRDVVRNKHLWGRYSGPNRSGQGVSYRQEELDAHVEARVRTLMMAGLTAVEILAQEASP